MLGAIELHEVQATEGEKEDCIKKISMILRDTTKEQQLTEIKAIKIPSADRNTIRQAAFGAVLTEIIDPNKNSADADKNVRRLVELMADVDLPEDAQLNILQQCVALLPDFKKPKTQRYLYDQQIKLPSKSDYLHKIIEKATRIMRGEAIARDLARFNSAPSRDSIEDAEIDQWLETFEGVWKDIAESTTTDLIKNLFESLCTMYIPQIELLTLSYQYFGKTYFRDKDQEALFVNSLDLDTLKFLYEIITGKKLDSNTQATEWMPALSHHFLGQNNDKVKAMACFQEACDLEKLDSAKRSLENAKNEPHDRNPHKDGQPSTEVNTLTTKIQEAKTHYDNARENYKQKITAMLNYLDTTRQLGPSELMGMIFHSNQPGNYDFTYSPLMILQKHELLTLLSKLVMKDENRKEFEKFLCNNPMMSDSGPSLSFLEQLMCQGMATENLSLGAKFYCNPTGKLETNNPVVDGFSSHISAKRLSSNMLFALVEFFYESKITGFVSTIIKFLKNFLNTKFDEQWKQSSLMNCRRLLLLYKLELELESRSQKVAQALAFLSAQETNTQTKLSVLTKMIDLMSPEVGTPASIKLSHDEFKALTAVKFGPLSSSRFAGILGLFDFAPGNTIIEKGQSVEISLAENELTYASVKSAVLEAKLL